MVVRKYIGSPLDKNRKILKRHFVHYYWKKNIVTSKLQINSVSKGVSYMMTKMVKALNADYNSSVKYLN